MDLPEGYAFRAPTRDDADAVGDVLLADQRADGAEPTLDAYFVRQAWSRPDLDLAADAWVVIDDAGAIVAYGQASREEPDVVGSWGVVHPAHRRRGHRLGAVRPDRGTCSRAARGRNGTPVPPLDQQRRRRRGSDGSPPGASGRSAISGTCRSTSTDRSIRDRHPTGSRSTGSSRPTISPPSTRSSPRRSWTTRAIIPSRSTGGWRSIRAARATTRRSGCWRVDGGVPIGALIASAGDDGGWVDWLAVLASHRGRGIGAALLRRSFAIVRCPRAPARSAQRRCRERDRSDGGLRARRDARRQPLGAVGALVRGLVAAKTAIEPTISSSTCSNDASRISRSPSSVSSRLSKPPCQLKKLQIPAGQPRVRPRRSEHRGAEEHAGRGKDGGHVRDRHGLARHRPGQAVDHEVQGGRVERSGDGERLEDVGLDGRDVQARQAPGDVAQDVRVRVEDGDAGCPRAARLARGSSRFPGRRRGGRPGCARRYRSTSRLVGHRQTNRAANPRTNGSYSLRTDGV